MKNRLFILLPGQSRQSRSRLIVRFSLILPPTLILSLFLTTAAILAHDKNKLHKNVIEAIALFKEKDPGIKKFFDNSYGYAIFPRVGKGGIGIGAAAGRGEVYEKGELIGTARLTQVNIGLQLGGQVYSEIVFFKSEKDLDVFRKSRLKLSAQVSAVAASSGAAANANYSHGVVIFTIARSGLMYEATIGGQRFKFKPL
jgi:lipid-binding SYLF domain-containing protein